MNAQEEIMAIIDANQSTLDHYDIMIAQDFERKVYNILSNDKEKAIMMMRIFHADDDEMLRLKLFLG